MCFALPRLTKEQQIYSKSLPLQEERRNYIDEMEYGLTQHPLAVYPHLEEAVPPEVRCAYFDIFFKKRQDLTNQLAPGGDMHI